MPILRDVAQALERHLNFPKSRTMTVAQRLREAGLLPAGAPGIAPELSIDHFTSLVIAVASDTTLHRVGEVVRRAEQLTPGGAMLGVDLTVNGEPTEHWPTAVPRSARQVLDVIAEMALGDLDSQRDVAATRLEFVSTWPEIAIHDGDRIRRFREPGANAAHWGENGHRRSTTISGGAFVSAVRSLFS